MTAVTRGTPTWCYAVARMIPEFRDTIEGLTVTVPTLTGTRQYINLDNAASTPAFISVLQTVNNFTPWYSSVHRGNGIKSRLSTQAYERAREVIADFVGANSRDHVVIFSKNTTEAINKLSYRLRLRKRDIVIISHLEHHSNDLPWRSHAIVKRVPLTAKGSISKRGFEELLQKYAGQVRLVAISGASNVTGHIPDIHWFARKAHEAGAQIFVDCAQLAAHRPIQIKSLDDPEHIDFIAMSAHKMYAPFGSGALIGRRDTFMHGEPEYTGGGTISSVSRKSVTWALPPDSEEAGSPNVIGAVAFAKAIQTLQKLGLMRIARHEAELTAYALKQLQTVPGLTIYGDIDPQNAHLRSGVIPFTLQNMPSHLVSAVLGYEWGIGVRSGCFCAQPYVMELLGVTDATQELIRYHIRHHRRDLVPGMVRISFGLYNTYEEVNMLVSALQIIAKGTRRQYILDKDSGTYTPVDLPGQGLQSFL